MSAPQGACASLLAHIRKGFPFLWGLGLGPGWVGATVLAEREVPCVPLNHVPGFTNKQRTAQSQQTPQRYTAGPQARTLLWSSPCSTEIFPDPLSYEILPRPWTVSFTFFTYPHLLPSFFF